MHSSASASASSIAKVSVDKLQTALLSAVMSVFANFNQAGTSSNCNKEEDDIDNDFRDSRPLRKRLP